MHLDLDDRARDLLAPVLALVHRGLDRFPDAGVLTVEVGAASGWSDLRGDSILLSEGLLGPEVHHPDEAPGPLPPLDRWRRAAACVLEGAALRELARRTGVDVGADWRWVGSAVDAADRVAPELSIAGPDLAQALATGDLGAHPRAGVAAMRAWRASGADPIERAHYLICGGILSCEEWLSLGSWVFDPRGAAALLPVPIERVADADIPVALGPWTWRPLLVPAHGRGGLIEVEGDGIVGEPWAVAEEAHRTLAASTHGCRLQGSPGGPVGRWEVASAAGFGQVLGARGIEFAFHGGGALELVLADAFVGPLAAVAMAEEVGTSGTVSGRWRVAGARRLAFRGVAGHGLTMHERRGGFLVPAQGFGLGQWLRALEDDAWAWEIAQDGRLVMRGTMMGGTVEVRLRPL